MLQCRGSAFGGYVPAPEHPNPKSLARDHTRPSGSRVCSDKLNSSPSPLWPRGGKHNHQNLSEKYFDFGGAAIHRPTHPARHIAVPCTRAYLSFSDTTTSYTQHHMYCTVQSPAIHLCATNTMQCISITVTYSPGCVAFSFSCARIYKTQFSHTHIQTHSSSIIQHHKKYKQTRLINKNTQYHVNATSPICLAVSALLYLVSFYRRSRLHHSSRLPYSVPQEKTHSALLLSNVCLLTGSAMFCNSTWTLTVHL